MFQSLDVQGDHREGELTRDTVLDVLSNERRRYVVHYLKRREGEIVTVGDLAEQVASWELDKPVAELDYKERKRVKNALQQFHLPKMEEMGFVEYDGRAGTVDLSRAASQQDFYVDVLPRRGIPWGVYYLGLSALGLALVAVLWLGAVPSTTVLPWSTAFVVVLTVSSVGHFYDNYYRMRLGAREDPPKKDK